jgi:hypothetical protein
MDNQVADALPPERAEVTDMPVFTRRPLALLAGALALAAGTLAIADGSVLPDGWTARDVQTTDGRTDLQGTGVASVWKLTGSGADIQGTADQFHFCYTTLPANGGITARLLSQSGGDPGGWSKSGVMLRENVEPGAMMAAIHLGGAGQYHANAQIETLHRLAPNANCTGGPAPNRDLKDGPLWLRAQRQGQEYQLLASDDGRRWRLLASQTVPISASKPLLAGLTATAHGKPVLAAVFDHVSVTPDISQPAPEGPSRLQAFPGDRRVLLTFSTVPNAIGYNIYRREPGQPLAAAQKLNTKPATNSWFIDTGAVGNGKLVNGRPLIYSVRAVFRDAARQATESISSPEATVTPG